MARVAGKDADALGLHVDPLEFPASSKADGIDPEHIWHALRSVYDPETVNIADLGLIYDVALNTTTAQLR